MGQEWSAGRDVSSSSAPRAGNAATRALARSALRLAGWRIEGEAPDEPKVVLVGAPHTTNLDFLLTKLTAGALGVRLHWVGKKSLFPRWLAPLTRHLGGIAAARTSPQGFVAPWGGGFRAPAPFFFRGRPGGARAPPP